MKNMMIIIATPDKSRKLSMMPSRFESRFPSFLIRVILLMLRSRENISRNGVERIETAVRTKLLNVKKYSPFIFSGWIIAVAEKGSSASP